MKPNRRATRLARRLFQLCVVNGRLDADRVRGVVRHTIGSGHRDSLGLVTRFQRMVRLERDRHSALVESAEPLTSEVRDAVLKALTERYGQGLEMSFVSNQSLIGGMRVTVGSDVYDGSIRHQLSALEARL
jgi:F-type H+-transporting ATPase subunit delta